MFLLDDVSAENHKNEWRLWGANEEGDMELLRNTSENIDEDDEINDEIDEEPEK